MARPARHSRRPARARRLRLGKHRCIAPPTSVKCAGSPRIAAHRDSITRNKTNKSHGSDATMEDATMEKGIFEGLKVLDCASFIAAPAAATVLSDFGADVVKIEPPGTGDPYRNLPNLPGYPRSEHNYAWQLEARNKRSIALDLAKPEAQAVLHRLVAEADVFITNFPPAVRQKLGLSYEKLQPLNPRLIYASFTGYGEKGAEADK